MFSNLYLGSQILKIIMFEKKEKKSCENKSVVSTHENILEYSRTVGEPLKIQKC